MLGDLWVEFVEAALQCVTQAHRELHSKFNYATQPLMLYSAMYQDGLIHAFEMLLARSRTGETSSPYYLHGLAESYGPFRREALRDGRYDDVAYIDGFICGTLLPLAFFQQKAHLLPLYYLFGVSEELRTLSAFRRALPRARHKAAAAYAKRHIKRFSDDPRDLAIHHVPFL